MSELVRLLGEEVVRRLEKLGFQRVQQRGSHLKKEIAKRVNSINKTIRHRLISQSMDTFYKGVYQDFSFTPSISALKYENPDVSYPAVEALKKIRGKDFGEDAKGRKEIKEVFKMNITKTKKEMQ